MALVAAGYGSSSEESDSEVTVPLQKHTSSSKTKGKSTSSSLQTSSGEKTESASSGGTLPSSKRGNSHVASSVARPLASEDVWEFEEEVSVSGAGSDHGKTESTLLSALPQPQGASASLLAGSGVSVKDDVLESFVKKVNYGTGELEKPPARKKLTSYSELRLASKKGSRVKIGIPSLSKVTGDSDDEDTPLSRPAPRPAASSSGGLSALLDKLPAPHNCSLKELGRSLLPKSLSRPPPPAAAALPRKPNSNTTVGVSSSVSASSSKSKNTHASKKRADNDDDDDDETIGGSSSGFFAFESSAKHTDSEVKLRETSELGTTAPGLASKYDTVTSSKPKTAMSLPPPSFSSLSLPPPTSSSFSASARVSHPDVEDQPLSFAKSSTVEYSEEGSSEGVSSSGWYSGQESHSTQGSEGRYSYGQDAEAWGQADSVPQPSETQGPSAVDQAVLNDEQFRLLQGRPKARRGDPTAIQFVDVDMSNHKLSDIEIMKGITQETGPSMAQRKKGEGPSGQQKRKHQITYLAHQAKEREFELNNTWSDNSASKRNTRQKYGF